MGWGWWLGPLCDKRWLVAARRSPADQAVGLICCEVTSGVGPYLALKAADCCAGQRPENTVHPPRVKIHATQCFLDLPSVCFRHVGLRGQALRWS
jgi:hypothetical protein